MWARGLGEDARETAKLVGAGGQVIGIDFSQLMVDEACGRSADSHLPVSFLQGDVQRLAFQDSSFHRCRAGRIFQHLPNPKEALREMIRATKPGGTLLIVGPDREMLVIDTPYKDVARRFLDFPSDGPQQGGIAHQLYALFKEAGLTNVSVMPMTDISTDYQSINKVMPYDGGIRLAAEHGVVTPEEAEAWIAYLEEAGAVAASSEA